MTVAAPTPRRTGAKSPRVSRGAPRTPARRAVAEAPRQPLELERISRQWQRALDAALNALQTADPSLPAPDLRQRLSELAATAAFLASDGAGAITGTFVNVTSGIFPS